MRGLLHANLNHLGKHITNYFHLKLQYNNIILQMTLFKYILNKYNI